MPMTARDLLEAANRLSQADRDWLVQELLHPLGDGSSEAEIEAAWGEEIKQRIEEIDSGAVQLISYEEFEAEMKALVASVRERANPK